MWINLVQSFLCLHKYHQLMYVPNTPCSFWQTEYPLGVESRIVSIVTPQPIRCSSWQTEYPLGVESRIVSIVTPQLIRCSSWQTEYPLGVESRIVSICYTTAHHLRPADDALHVLTTQYHISLYFISWCNWTNPVLTATFFFFQRQTSTNQRDAPGHDTGRSQGHSHCGIVSRTPPPPCTLSSSALN